MNRIITASKLGPLGALLVLGLTSCTLDPGQTRESSTSETKPDAAPAEPVCGDGVCDREEDCDADCRSDECDHECGDGMCGVDEDCPEDCDEKECDRDCEPEKPEEPEEMTGCTRTQGYWKNHHELATSPGLIGDWPAPHDEADLLCGEAMLDILHRPSMGDAWVILARQYIAAALNQAAGASVPTAVGDALAEAADWLAANCGGVPASQAPGAIALAETLDAYNHGVTGPGHCD
jgi:hypothetical protein